jgi:FkbH-like protein
MRWMPWLLPAPADFRAQLRAVRPDAPGDLIGLAHHALDIGHLGRLSAAIGAHRAALAQVGMLSPVRLGVASSHTASYLVDAFPATGLRHSLLLDCVTGDYGQVAQSVLDPQSAMVGAVDAVLLALDPRTLGLDTPRLREDEADAAVENAVEFVRGLCNGIRTNLGATCVLTTLPLDANPWLGNLDNRFAGAPNMMVQRFNLALAGLAEDGDVVVDIAQVANCVGLSNWQDPRGWHSAKLPFALDATPLYADHVCRVLAAARGKARKCLVLDLDNTLWGGVIGDDGLEGIKLGQGSAVGEAHVALQRYALALRDRGVILAVCSKNDEANARLPFREHGEMVLKEEHIAAFVANWSDKATNLRDIAAMLNIGTDALVFLDDNPAERAIIRQELPEVAVPEVGADAADYPAAIARAGYFEALSFSNEDRQRASFYQANAERRAVQAVVTDIAEYLRSLEMVATFAPFDAIGRSRISQLVNKSNQFNLTTQRYSDSDIAAFERSPDAFTLQVRLADRFGDNGMISVVIFDKGSDVWTCNSWLMSCRVLGRRVEEAVLGEVARAARAEGAKTLRGRYVPTSKNGLVERHFQKLGFTLVQQGDDGATIWELPLDEYRTEELPIMILSTALADAA